MRNIVRFGRWARAIAAAVLLVGVPDLFAAASPLPHPNVLVIITDQQQAGMLSCAGNHYVKTPVLDSLAATGARFDLAYCADPV